MHVLFIIGCLTFSHQKIFNQKIGEKTESVLNKTTKIMYDIIKISWIKSLYNNDQRCFPSEKDDMVTDGHGSQYDEHVGGPYYSVTILFLSVFLLHALKL